VVVVATVVVGVVVVVATQLHSLVHQVVRALV
jgi:hypothetical protein